MAHRRSGWFPRAHGSAERSGSGARSRSSPRSRSDRCRRRAPTRRRAVRRRSRGSRPAADVEDRAPLDRAVVGEPLERGETEPCRRVQPGPERHARVEGQDDVSVGGAMSSPGRSDHQPPADPKHGKCCFHASAQSASSTSRVLTSPIGRRSNTCRWPSADVDLGNGPLDRGRIGGSDVRPDRGRPSRIDARTQPLVHQLETRLDARPCRVPRGRGSR